MRFLFLDDDDSRWRCFRRNSIGHTADRARTADDAVAMIEANDYDRVYLDHDLDENNTEVNGTGMDVAVWLVNQTKRPEVVIHSLNGPCAEDMRQVLFGAGFQVSLRPWGWRDEQ